MPRLEQGRNMPRELVLLLGVRRDGLYDPALSEKLSREPRLVGPMERVLICCTQ